MRDGISNEQLVRGALQTLSGATPNASQAFDTRGFDAATFNLLNGTVTDAGTAAGFTMVIQHSDTLVGTDFVAVPAGEFSGTAVVTLDAADDVIGGSIGYLGSKRYVRAVFTGTSGTAAIVSVLAILGKPHRAPVTRIGTALATT